MQREDLLRALNTVAPALAPVGDMVPILKHFWFRKNRIMAFNNEIALSVPCDVGFSGAVPRALLDFVNLHYMNEITLECENGEVRGRVGRSKFKYGVLGEDQFVFEMPKPGNPLPVSIKELLESVDLCMQSVGSELSRPQTTGVTFVTEAKNLFLYATNGVTLTHGRVILSAGFKLAKPAVLPKEFCKQLLALKGDIKLEITDDYALATTDQGIALFGRLVEIEKPIDFGEIILTHLPKDYEKAMVTLPKRRFGLAVDLAVTVGDQNDYGTTRVVCQKERMSFLTRTERGEVADKVDLKGHPDVEVTLSCKHISEGIKHYDRVLVTDRCLIMANGKTVYLVAASSAKH